MIKEIENFFADSEESRSQSHVLGVVLMVAVTVIMASVVASFMFGMVSNIQTENPYFASEWEKNKVYIESEDEFFTNISLTHKAGKTVDKERLEVVYDSETVEGYESKGEYSGGKMIYQTTLVNKSDYKDYSDFDVKAKDEVEIRWVSKDNSESYVIQSYELDDDEIIGYFE